MAKVNPANLDPNAFLRIRGVAYMRESNGIFIVQKWPGKRGKPKTWKQHYSVEQFSIASRMAANAEWMSAETARYMSRNTVWLPRDLLVRAAYGKLYEIWTSEGELLETASHASPEGDPEWQPE